MDTPEYTVLNPDEPLSTDGLFDVLVTDENNKYVYDEYGKAQAIRYIIRGHRRMSDKDKTDIIRSVEKYGNVKYVLQENISQMPDTNSRTEVPSSAALKRVYDYAITHTYPATATNDGVLVASDKIKLDTVANNATKTTFNALYTDGMQVGEITINDVKTNLVIPISGAGFGVVKTSDNIENNDGVISVKTATLANKGVVQLSSDLTSESEETAATSKSLKQVYDYAVAHFNTSGTTVTTTNDPTQKAYLVGSMFTETSDNDTLIKDSDVYLTPENGRLYANQIQSNAAFSKTILITDDKIDVSKGTVFTTEITKNTSMIFEGAVDATCFTLIIKCGGKYNVTWPQNVSWSSGYAPDLSPLGTDILMFMTPDGGNNWYGFKSSLSTK